MTNGRIRLVYIAVLGIVAVVALIVSVAVADSAERTGTVAVATACVTAIALLARRD